MTLEHWVSSGWLDRHRAPASELEKLSAIVERELRDAAVEQISLDARLGMLYNAALRLADVALRRAGYRARRDRAHERVIASLRYTLGPDWADDINFLNTVRQQRHRADYESVGVATETTVRELRQLISRLRKAT